MKLGAIVARTRHTITVGDGTEIFFKDWGAGQPIVFSHGSPLNSDAWEDQMVFLADRGYRCIAHDRRGHGPNPPPTPPRQGSSGPENARTFPSWEGTGARCYKSARA